MARLIYGMNASLDGYIEDASGSFDWSEPDPAVHTFWNDYQRNLGTYLFGRRMYETMAVWETMLDTPGQPPEIRDFAEGWKAVDKVVFSRTLESVSTARTRIEREFDPAAIRELKAAASADLAIEGPNIAAQAIKAGLVDEYLVMVSPVIVGGGKPWLPPDVRINLTLVEERPVENGCVLLRYTAGD